MDPGRQGRISCYGQAKWRFWMGEVTINPGPSFTKQMIGSKRQQQVLVKPDQDNRFFTNEKYGISAAESTPHRPNGSCETLIAHLILIFFQCLNSHNSLVLLTRLLEFVANICLKGLNLYFN